MKNITSLCIVVGISFCWMSCEDNLPNSKKNGGVDQNIEVSSVAGSLIIESGEESGVYMYAAMAGGDTSVVINKRIPIMPSGKDTTTFLADTVKGEWFTIIKQGDIKYGKEFLVRWTANQTADDRVLLICIRCRDYNETITMTQKPI